jgi:signal transduction histidine kinase
MFVPALDVDDCFADADAGAATQVGDEIPTVPIPVLRACAPPIDIDRPSRMVAVAEAAPGFLHDLASSLQVMGGVEMAVEVVADGPPDVRQAATRAIAAWRRADALFGALRRLMRGGELVRRATDVGRLVDDIVERCGPAVRHGSHEPAVVVVSEPLIAHAVRELVRNAERAVPGGTVDIDVETGGPRVLVRVIDDGPGAPAHVSAVLDDPARSLDSGVAGAGLVSAALIVELHGGVLSYRRAPGRGACFTMSLPKS